MKRRGRPKLLNEETDRPLANGDRSGTEFSRISPATGHELEVLDRSNNNKPISNRSSGLSTLSVLTPSHTTDSGSGKIRRLEEQSHTEPLLGESHANNHSFCEYSRVTN